MGKPLDNILQPRVMEQKPIQVQPVNKLSEIQKWCWPVSDNEACRIMCDAANMKASDVHRETFNLRRYVKQEFDWNDEIFYKVGPGFDWLVQAPRIGPCDDNWGAASMWTLKNNPKTINSLVFWVPRMVPESCGRITVNQIKLLAAYKGKYCLPNWCLNGFGTMSYNVLLILERFHRCEERVPLGFCRIRVDTPAPLYGYFLNIGPFNASGLAYRCWRWAAAEQGIPDDIGCFPSGVLPLTR